ncbi:hypothetical protein Pelo_12558 [Pelomyxa schiedti]|nr:hypothetical protein Pelo_12558 [Pelomyxa schiedti]
MLKAALMVMMHAPTSIDYLCVYPGILSTTNICVANICRGNSNTAGPVHHPGTMGGAHNQPITFTTAITTDDFVVADNPTIMMPRHGIPQLPRGPRRLVSFGHGCVVSAFCYKASPQNLRPMIQLCVARRDAARVVAVHGAQGCGAGQRPQDSQAVVAMLAPSSPGGTQRERGGTQDAAGCEGAVCVLHLWTLWGNDKYVSVMSNVFRQCTGVVYVYNTHNLDSFMEVKSLNTTVEKYAPQAPRLLVPSNGPRQTISLSVELHPEVQSWIPLTEFWPLHLCKEETRFCDSHCKFCGGFIWGLVKQGQSCRVCKYPVHHKCAKRAEEKTSCLKNWCNNRFPRTTTAMLPPRPKAIPSEVVVVDDDDSSRHGGLTNTYTTTTTPTNTTSPITTIQPHSAILTPPASMGTGTATGGIRTGRSNSRQSLGSSNYNNRSQSNSAAVLEQQQKRNACVFEEYEWPDNCIQPYTIKDIPLRGDGATPIGKVKYEAMLLRSAVHIYIVPLLYVCETNDVATFVMPEMAADLHSLIQNPAGIPGGVPTEFVSFTSPTAPARDSEGNSQGFEAQQYSAPEAFGSIAENQSAQIRETNSVGTPPGIPAGFEAMWRHDPTMRPNIGTVVKKLKEITLELNIPHDQPRTDRFGLELEVSWNKFSSYVTADLNQKPESMGAMKRSPLGIGRDLTAKQFYNLAQCFGSFPANQAHFLSMVTLCNQVWFAGLIDEAELRGMLHRTPGSFLVRKRVAGPKRAFEICSVREGEFQIDEIYGAPGRYEHLKTGIYAHSVTALVWRLHKERVIGCPCTLANPGCSADCTSNSKCPDPPY